MSPLLRYQYNINHVSDTDRLLPSLFSVHCSQLHKDVDWLWCQFFKYSGVVFTLSHFNLFMFYDFTVCLYCIGPITVAVCCPCGVINDDDNNWAECCYIKCVLSGVCTDDQLIFQWRVRRLQIQDKIQGTVASRTGRRKKDCPGKSRTDGYLTIHRAGVVTLFQYFVTK